MSKHGNEILLKARQHARASRVVETLQKIDVPEWDCAIFYWPEMSVEEKKASLRFLRPNVVGGLSLAADSMVAAAELQVLYRARDEMGDRLFTDDDDAAIADTHPDVLVRISNAMGWGSKPTLEESEKN